MNIMVNYYRYDNDLAAHQKDLPLHRKSGRVCYALMDFNQSIILPANTCIKTCRRPAQEARHGFGGYKPWDISLGEPTYNPFAYDVGMLGNLFGTYLTVSSKQCHYSKTGSNSRIILKQDVVRFVPGCAALFDRMTTWVVPQRFTADEALEFFHNITDGLELDTPVKLKVIQRADEHWDKLTPKLYCSWSQFRTPPVTWWSNVLEWFLQFKPTRSVILATRRLLGI